MEFAGLSVWNRQPLTDSISRSIEPLSTRLPQSGVPTSARSSIVVIDPTVEDYQQLIAGIQPGTEVYVLNPAQDAIAQITNVLLGRSNISSLHIVSHGEAGALQLGETWLDQTRLDRYANDFQAWSTALTDDADILLYGCAVAQGEQGQAFLQKFSQLTGADIAASNDFTGDAAQGGNWNLEVNTGTIAASIAFDSATLAAYHQLLPVDLISVADSALLSTSVGIDNIGRNSVDRTGRYAVFTSSASTLVDNDNNNASDVFLYDRQNNTVELISQSRSGNSTAAGRSFDPIISYDGSSVAFISAANDLVESTAANSTAIENLYVWQRGIGITLVSKDQSGKSGTGNSSAASISDDGSYIAFQTQAALASTDINLRGPSADVYVWSRSTGSLTHVSRNRTGTRSRAEGAYAPVISGNGEYVAFTSAYNNLSPDTNNQIDVFLWQRGEDNLINLTSISDRESSRPVISADGSRVAFVSGSSKFAAANNQTDTNNAEDVFVWTRSSTDPLSGTIQLVSLNSTGTDSGNASAADLGNSRGSQTPSISRDGRYIAFTSSSTDLVDGDTNNAIDVFVRDLVDKQTQLVSRSDTGAIGNQESRNATISADGTRVVFVSSSSNLTTNDTNGLQDVFVRDVSTPQGATYLVSRNRSNQAGNGLSGGSLNVVNTSPSIPVISGNGKFVAFVSQASDLVPSDTNGIEDGFIVPVNPSDFTPAIFGNAMLMTARTSVVTLRTGSGNSATAAGSSISADGRFIVFTSAAAELTSGDTNGWTDVFLRDRQTGKTTLISRTQTSSANGASSNPLISADGRYVVFTSEASNLVDGDTNGAIDIFWYDRNPADPSNPRLVLVSRADKFSANGASLNPIMSSDGRYVAFTSTASNLVANDTNNQDVFVWDSVGGSIKMVSQGSNGTSEQPVISSDGRYIAFVSDATNLTSGDTNGKRDVFVWDRNDSSITLVSRNGAIGDGESYQPSISTDGRVIAFTSTSRNLGPTLENDDDEDVFVRYLNTSKTVLVSATPTGSYSATTGAGFGEANGLRAWNPKISGNGQFVVFNSNFSNLVATDTNGVFDVFRRNLALETTQLASSNLAGTDSGNAATGTGGDSSVGNGTGSSHAMISNDGRYVVFTSYSSNLVNGDQNASLDIFVRDFASNKTILVSRIPSDDASGNNPAYYPVLSSDGKYVAFTSTATNLTSRDLNGKADVFGLSLAPIVSLTSIKDTTTEVSGTPTPAKFLIRRTTDQPQEALTVKLTIDASSTASFDDYDIEAEGGIVLVRSGSELTIVMPSNTTEVVLFVKPKDDLFTEPVETAVLNLVTTSDYSIADSQGTVTANILDTDTVVTNTNDNGVGSLRQAILNANATSGTNTISFQITGTETKTISLLTALPEITDATIIDATTQATFNNVAYVAPLIALDGSNTINNGLQIAADNSLVKGLNISRFTQNGILIASSGNTITDNIISSNGDGIAINAATSTPAIKNRIEKNSIFANTGLGIDLGKDGATANDLGDLDTGANNLQNTVILDSAFPNPSGARIRGRLNGAPEQTFRVELFSEPANRSAQTFLTAIDITTDINGNATLDYPALGLTAGQFVTATVTDKDGNTSEFAIAREISLPKVTLRPLDPNQISQKENSANGYSFEVVLDQVSDQPVVVSLSTGSPTDTATATTDYTPINQTLTFAPGEISKPVTIQAVNDSVQEPSETLTVSVSPQSNNVVAGATTNLVFTILDDDQPPTLSIANLTQNEGKSGTTSFTFDVKLSNAAATTVTVDYTTADATASVGDKDYTAIAGTLTFNPGETSKTITVSVLGDTKFEPDETFSVQLSNVSNNATLGSNKTATATITNDDNLPTITIAGASAIDEGKTGITDYTFTVNLSEASSTTTSVSYSTLDLEATTGDGDYIANSGTLTFAPGITSQIITVKVTGDNKFESDERFKIALSNPVNATLVSTEAIGMIRNDDSVPTLSIQTSSGQSEGNSGTTPYEFVISLSNPADRAITVNYAASDATAKASEDYTFPSGSLTFAPGELTKKISATILGDTIYESNETFAVKLSGASVASIATDTAIATILNDDALPTVTVQDITANEGESGNTPFQFVVRLSNASDKQILVNYTTENGSATVADQDYELTTGTLTFNPGELEKTVAVNVKGDTKREANETFKLKFTSATNAQDPQNLTALATITNDDGAPGISITPTSVTEGGVLNFVVTLSKASSEAIAVDFSTTDGTATLGDKDYTNRSGTLAFAPGETSKTISIQTTTDTKFESDETINLTLTNAQNATIDQATASGTIKNDDLLPKVSITSVSDTEGTEGTTKDFVFNVTLSNPSSQPVTVSYATQDGTAQTADNDYRSTSGQLVFAPGEVQKTITVKVNGDRKFERDETFSIQLTATNADLSSEPGQGVGTIQSDDSRPTITIAGDSKTEGNSGTTALLLPVTLSNPSSETITVAFITKDGTATTADSDYTSNAGTLTFAPGETTKTIAVQAIGDTHYEPNEAFAVELSNPTNASLINNSATGTILNDDPLPQIRLSATPARQPEANSALTPFTFEISLSEAISLPITVNYTTADGTATIANNDYVSASGTITFTPGETRKTITVNVLGDTLPESDETFQIVLSKPTNATLAIENVTATIVNDDASAPSTDDGGPYDILWRNGRTGENLLWLPSSNVFNRATALPEVSDLAWQIMATADFDGQAGTDILWRNTRTGETGIWRMDQNQFVQGILLPTVTDSSWEIQGVGDFNKDRKTDILWRNARTGENAVWLLDGTTFTAGIYLPSVADTSWRIVGNGDFDNDGDSDILWYNARAGETAIWQMNGTQFETGRYLPQVSDLAWQVEGVGDFNNDRFLDILWRNSRTGETGLWLMKSGFFDRVAMLPTVANTNWQIESIGDLNNDGKLDLLWRNSSTLEALIWYLNGEQYGFSTMIQKLPNSSWAIGGIGDFNGDRQLDILLRDYQGGGNSIWQLNPSTFNRSVALDSQPDRGWEIQDAGDFDNDGEADILWRNLRSGETSIWFVKNEQVRERFIFTAVPGLNWQILKTGDFNRDGNRDILWRDMNTGGVGVWLLNQGRFDTGLMIQNSVDLNWDVEGVADFNGDRNLDLLWRNKVTGEVGVWLMNRTTLTQGLVFATIKDLNWQIEGVGDFNLDGRPDLLWRNSLTGETGIWMMNGTRLDNVILLPKRDIGWTLSGMGDFNRDNQLDLLWRNAATGENSVWYLNGGNFGLESFVQLLIDANWRVGGIDDF